jgi:hypothetical protein
MKQKTCSNKINKPLAKLTERRKEKPGINKTTAEKREYSKKQ